MTTLRTPLEVEETRELLRGYGLKLHSLAPLSKGTINSNYRAQTDAGPLFLRVNEGKTDHEVRFEADLIWHLTSHGVHTPAVWRTQRGQPFVRLPGPDGGVGKQLMLMSWVEGDELTDDQIGEREAASVGAALAGLHLAALGFPGRRIGTYTLSHIEARVQRLHHEPRIPDGIVEYLQREVLRQKATRTRDLPAGIGHNDLFPDNLLFTRKRRQREVAWILDLEQAAVLPYAYDLAVALLAFCAPLPNPVGPADPEPATPGCGEAAVKESGRAGPLALGPARALLAAYQDTRPLSPVERLALYEEARFAALRFTVTRLTDVHLAGPPGHATAHTKDFRDFLRRLESLDALGAAAFNQALC